MLLLSCFIKDFKIEIDRVFKFDLVYLKLELEILNSESTCTWKYCEHTLILLTQLTLKLNEKSEEMTKLFQPVVEYRDWKKRGPRSLEQLVMKMTRSQRSDVFEWNLCFLIPYCQEVIFTSSYRCREELSLVTNWGRVLCVCVRRLLRETPTCVLEPSTRGATLNPRTWPENRISKNRADLSP